MLTVSVIYNRRNRLKKSGKAAVDIRITIDRVPYYIPAGIDVFPDQWDAKNRKVNQKHPLAYKYNELIRAITQKIESISVDATKEGRQLDYTEIKAALGRDDKQIYNFNKFCEHEINHRTDLAGSTRRQHLGQLERIREYDPSLTFSKITFSWIQKFDQHMAGDGLGENTRWKYHKFIKTYLNVAIKKGLTKQYEYKHFKTKQKQGEREALTLDQLKELETIDREKLGPDHIIVLDKFLFSCYSGLRISDMAALTLSAFEGKKPYTTLYMSVKMEKTSRIIRNMPLHKLFGGKAVEIFKKYAAGSSDEKLFPWQHNNLINDKLKDIATHTSIDNKLSFHVARHTFGSALAELTGDVMLIKELMGHSKVETSMIYIHMSKRRIESKLDRFDFDY